MFENLASFIKEDEELDERFNVSTAQHVQSLKTVFKRYFLSLKNKKSLSYEIRSRLLLMLWIFPMHYKPKSMIIKIICPHVIFFRKWHSLGSSALCANPTHKYPNWLFEYYFHLSQHTMPLRERLFSSCTYQKRKHEIKVKLKMI